MKSVKQIRKTVWVGKEIVYYDVTDSTNTRAKTLAEKGGEHGTLILADRQEAGRGRRGRTWESPENVGIFMSLIMKPELEPEKASMLTLVAAMAVAKAIKKKLDLPVKIKWPNDIVLNGKKICGILTEMSAQREAIHYVVVGIGINVSNQQFPKELETMATSLAIESGREICRAELLEAVWEQFEFYYNKFYEKKDLSDIKEEYDAYLVNQGREVRVLDPSEPFEGIAKGITSEGELIVAIQGGEKLVSSGEVSVRGIYGYI